MEQGAWTIKQLAQGLSLSANTIRRKIKAGKIKAKLGQGDFGKTWYITELPPEYEAKLKPPTLSELLAEINHVISRWERLFRAVVLAEKEAEKQQGGEDGRRKRKQTG